MSSHQHQAKVSMQHNPKRRN